MQGAEANDIGDLTKFIQFCQAFIAEAHAVNQDQAFAFAHHGHIAAELPIRIHEDGIHGAADKIDTGKDCFQVAMG
ncbi:hypothetical protein GCM10027217_16370 [Pseudomaricurvus hydrocarbonicus]